jgi:hypothetical protein
MPSSHRFSAKFHEKKYRKRKQSRDGDPSTNNNDAKKQKAHHKGELF